MKLHVPRIQSVPSPVTWLNCILWKSTLISKEMQISVIIRAGKGISNRIGTFMLPSLSRLSAKLWLWRRLISALKKQTWPFASSSIGHCLRKFLRNSWSSRKVTRTFIQTFLQSFKILRPEDTLKILWRYFQDSLKIVSILFWNWSRDSVSST